MALPDLDPNKDPAAAKAWINKIMAGLQQAQAEMGAWYAALVEQIALGVVRCDDVLKYNREAMRVYAYAADFYEWLRPVIERLRAMGYNMLPNNELPYPQLIGTRFQVQGPLGHRTFDVGLQCMGPNDRDFSPATPRGALQVSPQPSCARGGQYVTGRPKTSAPTLLPDSGTAVTQTKAGTIVYSPYESIEQLSYTAGLGSPAIAICATPLGAVFCLGALLIVFIGSYQLLALITGAKRAEIEANVLNQEREQDRKRAEFQLACMKQRLGITPGMDPSKLQAMDPNQVAKWQDECTAIADKTFPKRELPGGFLAALTGLAVVIGVSAVGVVLLRSRRAAAQD